MRTIQILGAETLELAHLVLDVNGTLSDRGVLIDGVADRLRLLADDFEVHIATANTFGTAVRLASDLGLAVTTVTDGADKVRLVTALGAEACVAIGNGRNDEGMLRAARLGIAVIGPEGAAATTVQAADVVCRSILDALDLLADERLLIATLRV